MYSGNSIFNINKPTWSLKMVKHYHNLYPLRNRQYVKYKKNKSSKYLRVYY